MKKILFLILMPVSVLASNLDFELRQDEFYSIDISYHSNDETMRIMEPDLNELKKKFQILSSHSRIRKDGNRINLSFRYTILPQRAGQLTIPALLVQDKITPMTTINVSEKKLKRMRDFNERSENKKKVRNKKVEPDYVDFDQLDENKKPKITGAMLTSPKAGLLTAKKQSIASMIAGRHLKKKKKFCWKLYIIGASSFFLGIFVIFSFIRIRKWRNKKK